MSKPVKNIAKAVKTGTKSVVQTLVGAPKIVQEEAVQPAGAVDRQAVRPLAALGTQGENQEEATRDLYRRRRARGVATSPMGLTGQASVQRKTLLGS